MVNTKKGSKLMEQNYLNTELPKVYPTELPKVYPTPAQMVAEFYKQLGRIPDSPLAEALVFEEFDEWKVCGGDGPTEELKELADLIYVIYGYALANGWDLDEALYRVHANNLGRMTQPDGTIKRRADGKVIKNPDYPKVDLSDLV